MKLQAYPKYKPSGIEWLGDVPEHWYIKAIKWETPVMRGASPRPIDDPIYFDDYGEYAWVRISDVTSAGTYLDTTEQKLSPLGSSLSVKLKPGMLFLSIAGSVGKACITKIKCCIHDGFVYFPRFKGNTKFLYYLFASGELYRGLGKLGTQLNLNTDTVGSIVAAFPDKVAQPTISTFLDHETGQLDRLVAKKQELIERLKEKRTALISRAVTQGLPDEAAAQARVPVNPALKPSGLDWLGDIPEHWEVRKFSREVAIAEGQVDPEKEPYASMLLIGPEHVQSSTGRLLQRATAADQAAESGKYLCRHGDVIYSKIRPALRKLIIAPEDCLCSADMYPLNSRGRLINRFVYWLFLSDEFSGWSVLESDRVAMPKLNRDTLNELRMPVPPLIEQTAISAYLDAKTEKLDALVAKVEEAVERLQEYRTALITAAVTGKVDCRKVSA